MAALGWLLNLDFAGGTAEAVVVPTVPGIEFRVPDNRIHFTVPDNRIHYTVEDNRIHYLVEEE